MAQQLVGRIKKSSRYSAQAPRQTWFTLTIVDDRLSPIRGNDNNYRFCDVAMGVVVGGHVVELDTGKKIKTEIYGLRSLADA